jgi:FAD/FMN-containing dehydrogenase
MNEGLLQALASVLGPERVHAPHEGFAHYASDWAGLGPPDAAAVVLPREIREVQALVAWATKNAVALVPSGGRTGLSGGACALHGEVVVSLERFDRVLAHDPVTGTLSVEAGVRTQQVQEAARSNGMFYPVDFASRGSSQIGGNIATNAGGIRVLRYGLTRDWVTGLKVVAGTGEVLDLNRGLAKNATGYDLRHLFIGSEGTLGIIVEATLQLANPPLPQQVMVLGLPSLDAIMDVFSRLRRRLALSAFEFFTEGAVRHVAAAGGRRPFAADPPCYVLAEFDEDEAAATSLFEACFSEGLVLEGVVSQSNAQAAELWRLREGVTESLARHRPYKNDISVRVSQVPAFLARADALFAREYPGFEVVWFGHIGDGNLHISVLPPAGWSHEAFVVECGRVTHQLGELLREFDGSVSAEHGIGLLKRPYLQYTRSAGEIAFMRQIKQVFDPAGIMNPGKLFPP